MCRKIAIYVEGQSEHVFINHLIKIWWNFSGIRIDNIKLVNDLKNPIQHFYANEDYEIHFVIINVEGLGSLNSTISKNASKQIDQGFQLIALRDLDFENVSATHKILEDFKKSLHISGCKYFEKIELYFAVMTIEAWFLAFTHALSKWAKISETEVNEMINNKSPEFSLEQIRSPANLLASIGRKRGKDPKVFHEVMSLVAEIDREMIHQVYHSSRIPRFNLFWEKLIY